MPNTNYAFDFYAADPNHYASLTAAQYLAVQGSFPSLGRLSGDGLLPGATAELKSLTPQKSNPNPGQIVAWEVTLDVDDRSGISNGIVELTLRWDATTTSGENYGFDHSADRGVLAAFVDTSDSYLDDASQTATVLSKTWRYVDQPGTDDWLEGTITLGGLDAGDHITLEIWTALQESGAEKLTGNIQSSIVSAKVSGGEAINVGTRTIPLKVADPVTFSISGASFEDSDANGLRGTGEGGLSGWTVLLTGPDGSVTSTSTDASGHYTFSGLAAGTYTVSEALPSGYQLTVPGSTSHRVTLGGSDVTGLDFGSFRAASIAGTVYQDSNRTGAIEAGDATLAGVTVFIDANGNGQLDAGELSAVTGSDGAYRFDGLKPGDYAIAQVLPGGTAQLLGAGTVSLAYGAKISNGHFLDGVLPAASAGLQGLVWNDGDGDGIRSAADPVFAGIAVSLLAADGHVVATTSTSGDGSYGFAGLAAGQYRLAFSLPANLAFTLADRGSDDTRDSDVNPATGRTGLFTLSAGSVLHAVDAGLAYRASGTDATPGVVLGAGADQYNGTDDVADHAFGGDGDDILLGLGQDDVFHGQNGNDFLDGHTGDDALFGGAGNDRVHGQAGDDVLDAGPGDDTIEGGDGRDIDLGGEGDDRMQGENGDDWLFGGAGQDILEGNAGRDFLSGGTGNDLLAGHDSNDVLLGGPDDGRVSLVDGTVTGLVYGDTIYGDAAGDLFVWRPGDGVDVLPEFHWSDGDTLVILGYSGFQAVEKIGTTTVLVIDTNAAIVMQDFYPAADLSGPFPGIAFRPEATELPQLPAITDPGTPVRIGAELASFYGTESADFVIGSAAADTLLGNGGGDWIRAGAGDDLVMGGAGADTMEGEEGNDVLQGGDGNDTLAGGAGNDTLYGGAGTDTILLDGTASEWRLVRGTGGQLWARNLSTHETDYGVELEQVAFADGTLIDIHNLAVTAPLEYVASYGDLTAAFGTNAAAGIGHLLQYGLAEGRTTTFDGLRYAASYADLANAFGTDEGAAAAHYIQFGRAEGRAASFDSLRYFASNNDLLKALGEDVEAATAHYIQYGRFEGRSMNFDALAYAASYNDLSKAFGTNTEAATLHYIRNGHVEGRIVSFDAAQYTATYGDLIKAFGTDAAAAEAHWLAHGYAEGRARDLFDAAQYLAKYADLQAAFGSDERAATIHYIQYGFAEGRTDEPVIG
ncbi:MAG TPA: SdrD B-like domain-containing protein [Roseomonas sp.]|nr:SdrD B-like domain-containing protein [Roseomonas sp.]